MAEAGARIPDFMGARDYVHVRGCVSVRASKFKRSEGDVPALFFLRAWLLS